jgi:hypothetical protein
MMEDVCRPGIQALVIIRRRTHDRDVAGKV